VSCPAERQPDANRGACPAYPPRFGRTALDVLGDRWSLLIVAEALFAGTCRFNDFRRALHIPSNVLTVRLRRLVGAGVLVRSDTKSGRSSHKYLLTPAGAAFGPVLRALSEWSQKWSAPVVAHEAPSPPGAESGHRLGGSNPVADGRLRGKPQPRKATEGSS
jgi:DNA-binding HxlR family transcriptional regulator